MYLLMSGVHPILDEGMVGNPQVKQFLFCKYAHLNDELVDFQRREFEIYAEEAIVLLKNMLKIYPKKRMPGKNTTN